MGIVPFQPLIVLRGCVSAEVRKLRLDFRGVHPLFRGDALLRPYPFICTWDEHGLYGRKKGSPAVEDGGEKIRLPSFLPPPPLPRPFHRLPAGH